MLRRVVHGTVASPDAIRASGGAVEIRYRDARSWRAVILITICGVLLASGMLWHVAEGDSSRLNLVWHEGFVAELRAGAAYPRWINSTNQGLGAPSFYFYAPLPFWVSGLLDIISPVRAGAAFWLNLSALIAVVASGLAMYAALAQIVRRSSAVIAAVAYMALPYHFGLDFCWRAAIGELWGFVWPPLLLLGIIGTLRAHWRGPLLVTIASVGLMLSHLPSFLIVTCGLGAVGIVSVMVSADRATGRHVSLRVVVAVALATCITAGYWLPAILTIDLTDVNGTMTGGRFYYAHNFTALHTPWAVSGFIANTALLMLALLGLLVVLAKRQGRSRDLACVLSVSLVIFATVMITPASGMLWRLLPPLQRVQFPWRFLILVDVGISVMIAHVIDTPELRPFRAFVLRAAPLVCLLLGSLYPAIFSPVYWPEARANYVTALRNNADAFEYRTRWTSEEFYRGVRAGTSVIPGDAVRRAARSSHGAVAVADLVRSPDNASTAILDRFYYPNLRVTDAQRGTTLPTMPQPATGLALVTLPVGVTTIRVATGWLREERIAWAVSAVALAIAIGLGLRRRSRGAARQAFA